MWENDSMERIELFDLLSNGPEVWRLAADALVRGTKFDLDADRGEGTYLSGQFLVDDRN
jgi:hypothetical protein